jgi:hypothetical protein
MNKKGQGIQFNWIFVAIVGIIILLFFLGFLVKYIDLQDSKENAEIARGFANSIFGAKSTEQYKNFSVSKSFNVGYDCEDLIVNGDQRFNIPYTLVMDNITSNNFIIWVKEYRKGFLVDRVVFISDADTEYYFGDASYLDELPPIIKIASSSSDADVSVVGNTVSKNGRDFVVGSSESFYVFAGAFSNKNNLECLREKLDERYNLLSDVYFYKIQQVTGNCDYNSLRDAIILKDVNSMEGVNDNLDGFGCEVVY